MASIAEKGGEGPKSHARRDELLDIQAEAQKLWEEENLFEVDAPEVQGSPEDHYFGNFPYPYMNGLLHLGHAFTVSKVEFATAYKRLRGKKTLFPFAFHCTGMPIKACADKLDREIKEYGNPPVFPEETDEADVPPPTSEEIAIAAANAEEAKDPSKFKGKKSKVQAKAGKGKFQWQIMESLGLKPEDIAQFRDPIHWLKYFPPLAKEDLVAFGAGVDWRRSFITTDMNQYYDSFVRWHFNTLRKKGKVVRATRYAVYSPFDGQPCADHDRASGEGVGPQEYTLIKMEVIAPFTGKLAALEGKRVFLAAATLRPETMYGQTNAWVLPEGQYGAFEINDTEVFVMTKRAALNYAYQGGCKEPGKPKSLLELTGHDLLGLPLKSPLTSNERIYALPMLTILTDKGTGVVTSVPSDAPDDYAALMDLKSKPALRAKFNLKDKWVMPFEIIPIINIPEFGDTSAVKVCEDLKIKSQNDKEKLAQAKQATYLKGFTEGTMLVGEHKGAKVKDAKPLLRKLLVETGQAVLYSEPEKKVMSRSGDECVVALTDQWYITYGEEEWRAATEKALAKMEVFHDEARRLFEHNLSWLEQWACSRSFGLGTKMPWDSQFLIESLSDSTVYMAYYTVAHILQRGDIYGTEGAKEITAAQMTDEVWDHIFLEAPPPETDISPGLLKKMRQEFNYWYPFDLRVSGKDLIRNHLTFSIYNHTAIFPEKLWPKAFRTNGHLMLNSEKMSKSTGNFKTLRQAIEEMTADATRFALADAGDTMDDANFLEETANTAILRLTKELAWVKEVAAAESSLRTGDSLTFADRVFANDLDIAIALTEQNYEHLMFREALKTGFYDLQLARDNYRLACGSAGLHKDLFWRFVKTQTQLLTPICPHYSEHVWRKILKQSGSALVSGWPTASAPDYTLKAANEYLQDVIVDLRKAIQTKSAAGKKAKKVAVPTFVPAICHVFVAEKFGGWQEECLKILQQGFIPETKAFPSDAELMAAVKGSSIAKMADAKKVMGMCMPFLKFKKDEAEKLGARALDLSLAFDEAGVLRDNSELIKRQLGLKEFSVFLTSDAAAVASAGAEGSKIPTANPGKPVAVFLAAASATKSQLYLREGAAGTRALKLYLALATVDVEVKPLGSGGEPAEISTAAGTGAAAVLADGQGVVTGVATVLRYLSVSSKLTKFYPPPGSPEAARCDEQLDWCTRHFLSSGASRSQALADAIPALDQWLTPGAAVVSPTIADILLAASLQEARATSSTLDLSPPVAEWMSKWEERKEWQAVFSK